MSCNASIVAVVDGSPGIDGETLLDRAIARLDALERRWSRFLPDSEISTLNAHPGTPVAVSLDTVRLVEAMVHGWHATHGAFDPTLLGALVELGYAQSRTDLTARTSLASGVDRRGRPEAILVDPEQAVVVLPPGTAIDPGGIGKGLAADLVVAELIAAGASGALVEIGGDVRVAGLAPDPGYGWIVAVDTAAGTPVDTHVGTDTVALSDGGVATSTSRLRTWRFAGADRHHLIDPTTLRPSETDAISCTVIAGSASWAEAFTKVAFTLPPPAAISAFESRRLAASITTHTGERLTTSTWGTFLR